MYVAVFVLKYEEAALEGCMFFTKQNRSKVL